ncbi:facilitated trehalose transporter Tret1-like [Bradysia coprophila]|uniref:facilitated trehalose transporter Tret1-like n=1 Tax=Bradysia coprophila TaxID=38358 RepID=UPI00187DB32D|nr:facilitated trehalose transporter Tret1-like [Bradysia coprophila]
MAEVKVSSKQSIRNQYLAAFTVSLYPTAFGISYGWASPSTLLLTSDDSPLPSGKIDIDEASWVVSLACLGGLVGNIIFGFATSTFGRKKPLIFLAIPSIISWLLIWFAQNVYYLYAARFLNGMTGGGMYILIPLFLIEIANDRVRGTLGSLVILTTNLGLLLSFILGEFCDYNTTPKVTIVLIIIYAILFSIFPESPSALMKQNKITEAEKSIRFYQRIPESDKDESLQFEMNKLRTTIGCDKIEENSFNWSDLTKNPGRRAFIMGVGLAILYEFCGVIAMLNYSAIIFQETGSSMSPNMSAIVIGSIQLVGSIVTTNLVDRAGRKVLYVVSTTGTAFGQIILASYMMLKSMGYNVEAYNFVPITCFSLVLFLAAWGILTLPFLVIAETMPENLKDLLTSFCVALIWALEFALIKFLPFLNEILGFHGSLFLFAGICLIGTVLIILFVPETKGKSYEEIMKMLQ